MKLPSVMENTTIIKPNTPDFFKPILPGFDQKLSIPKSFMAYLNGEKPEAEAILKSANQNKSWRVMVEGRYFQKGWKEFAQDHHLCVGDFLVFRHQGGMVFHVKVFDYSTTCLRQYSKPMQDEGRRSSKRKRECGDEKEKKRIGSTSTGAPSLSSSVQAPYFTTKMLPYNVKSLNIPGEFVRSNGLGSRLGEFTLKSEEGESWKVLMKHTQNKYNGRFDIHRGWSKFFKDTGLKFGDICTFKLVSTGQNVIFEVTISCSKEVNVGVKLNWSVEEEEIAPYFTAEIQPHNFTRSRMIIPQKFVRINGLMERSGIITLTNEEQQFWQVNLRHRKAHGQVCIGGGWGKFSKANNLSTGDLCTFKLVSNGENVVFKVTVSRFDHLTRKESQTS